MFCERCGHIFNSAFDPSRMEYTETYENSLHYSPRFQEYASRLASALIDRYDLHGKTIIEIGCGSGDFLRILCAMGGNRGIGFDPSFNGRDAANLAEQDIEIIPDVYSDRYVDCKADFICCRHVLEHIGQPRNFLCQPRRAIGLRDTVVYFEVPNVLYTLKDLGIWDLIFEHYSYFSAGSLTRLFVACGFLPRDVYPAFGDQFLCIEASGANGGAGRGEDRSSELAEVSRLVSDFGGHYGRKIELWTKNLKELMRVGKRVVLWGAGSKGVTFLNVVPGGELIECVVDINPQKHGSYVAGTGQRILKPEWIAEARPDTVLVMNPIYRDEIQRTIARLGAVAEIVVV